MQHNILKPQGKTCYKRHHGQSASHKVFLFQTKMSCMVLETTSGHQGSEKASSTMIPQMAVVADVERSEDYLSLK